MIRKQHNRYRTEPYGNDYRDVLKRGKAFFTIEGEHYSFEMSQYHGIWKAHKRTTPGFCSPEGTIIVEWDKNQRKWKEREYKKEHSR